MLENPMVGGWYNEPDYRDDGDIVIECSKCGRAIYKDDYLYSHNEKEECLCEDCWCEIDEKDKDNYEKMMGWEIA